VSSQSVDVSRKPVVEDVFTPPVCLSVWQAGDLSDRSRASVTWEWREMVVACL